MQNSEQLYLSSVFYTSIPYCTAVLINVLQVNGARSWEQYAIPISMTAQRQLQNATSIKSKQASKEQAFGSKDSSFIYLDRKMQVFNNQSTGWTTYA